MCDIKNENETPDTRFAHHSFYSFMKERERGGGEEKSDVRMTHYNYNAMYKTTRRYKTFTLAGENVEKINEQKAKDSQHSV